MKLGKLFMTKGISLAIAKDRDFAVKVSDCFERYTNEDWGDLCESDKQLNVEALEYNDQIFAAYNTNKGKIYIITESDRSVTTILFADEY